MLDNDAFLRQEIESASSAKMRWMLIRKALGLVGQIRSLWEAEEYASAGQWTIRVQEILVELLAGVTDPQNVVAAQVADLYIYMGKLMHEASPKHDLAVLLTVEDLLTIEFETWSMFIQKEAELSSISRNAPASVPPPIGRHESAPATSLNLDA